MLFNILARLELRLKKEKEEGSVREGHRNITEAATCFHPHYTNVVLTEVGSPWHASLIQVLIKGIHLNSKIRETQEDNCISSSHLRPKTSLRGFLSVPTRHSKGCFSATQQPLEGDWSKPPARSVGSKASEVPGLSRWAVGRIVQLLKPVSGKFNHVHFIVTRENSELQRNP